MKSQPRLRSLTLLICCAAALSWWGCATLGITSSSDDSAPVTVPVPPEEQADAECAEKIEDARYKLCDDPPPTLPFDHLDRAKNAWRTMKDRCPEQMRTGMALRKLEKCIDQIESTPSLKDDAVEQRRTSGQRKARALKGSPEYGQAARRLKKALASIEDAAWSHERAVQAGDEKEERFQAAIWDEAEDQYLKARRSIEQMMEHAGLELDDGRAYGMW
ncbi:MAG: hypothetical protein LBM75_03790 [Myxococcales bacterium]|jgi:hypothetical protein|nr:hypothetical protein [Myxococcales bacterium]